VGVRKKKGSKSRGWAKGGTKAKPEMVVQVLVKEKRGGK